MGRGHEGVHTSQEKEKEAAQTLVSSL